MSGADRDHAIAVLAQIRADVADDVERFEGSPIQAVGSWIAGLSAALDALASILARVIESGDGAK